MHVQCLQDGSECQGSGAIGICCTGFCDQEIGNQFGVCGNRTSIDKGLDTTQIVGITFGAITVLLLIILITVGVWILLKRRRAAVTGAAKLTDAEIRRFFDGDSVFEYDEAKGTGNLSQALEAAPYDKNYEICDTDFTIDHSLVLGEGEFSIIMKGFVRGGAVAAKTVRFGTKDKNYIKALLTELKILIHIGNHTNIVSLVGASTINLGQGSCYIFLEYCEHGSLESYLRANRADFQKALTCGAPTSLNYVQLESVLPNLQPAKPMSIAMPIKAEHLMRWCHEISGGMAYLADLQVVHGDLAARNVLLSSGLVAKISDFGLSKRLYTYSKYVSTSDIPLPWRHMAPESLTQLIFSTQSDIWSFGITMWEIFTYGNVPYPGVEWSTQFIDCLQHNMRPRKPDTHTSGVTNELYEIMCKCWDLNPDQRPTFNWLNSIFKSISLCNNSEI